jgi:hypothetical protein
MAGRDRQVDKSLRAFDFDVEPCTPAHRPNLTYASSLATPLWQRIMHDREARGTAGASYRVREFVLLLGPPFRGRTGHAQREEP